MTRIPSRALLGALVAAVVAAPAAAAYPPAAGAPGARSVWTPADKQGFGTAHARASKVWFTLRPQALSEVYYPDLSTPSIRELEFAVARDDGRVERERDGRGRVRLVDGRSLTFRQVTTTPRWRLSKTVITDPARATVLLDVTFTSRTGRPQRLYALLDPALSNTGDDDRGGSARRGLVAWDGRGASALAGVPALGASSSGYAGARSDPWRDLRRDGDLDRRRDARDAGNVVQAARTALDGTTRRRMTLALGFGPTRSRAVRAARASLHAGYRAAAATYGSQWDAYLASLNGPPASAAPYRQLYDESLMVLAASEDKTWPGAGIASPTMPWAWAGDGIEKGRSGPYHLVWPRDLYHVATAMLAAGDRAAAERALDFMLFRQQKPDGSLPQNSEVTGRENWTGIQLDQIAFPLVLAWQLDAPDGRRWAQLRRAADFIVRTGPRTQQERWENQDGFSPATIAAEVAGLTCAADLSRRNGDARRAARYERTADRWAASVQRWTATTNGPLSRRPYYLRLTKDRRPDHATRYSIGDGGPETADQRRVVDPSFLELVRLGVKRSDDPVIRNTLRVVDRVLRVRTPNGRFWRRAAFDGYGEQRDGSPWGPSDPGTLRTLGRAWPILAGERGEYELLAGDRPAAVDALRAMARAANGGGMLPEQVWDGRPPTGRDGHRAGEGTFSATPLAWAHAQFVRLAWALDAGAPVETPSIVACRYAGFDCPGVG